MKELDKIQRCCFNSPRSKKEYNRSAGFCKILNKPILRSDCIECKTYRDRMQDFADFIRKNKTDKTDKR